MNLGKRLPPGAIVLTFDLETCAAPGGDARKPHLARIVQLGIAAFSGDPLPVDDATVITTPGECEEDGASIAGYIFNEATFIAPGCRIDAGSAEVHHITDAQVRGSPTISDCAENLRDWLTPIDGRPLYLCGYNAKRYDVPVLVHELRRTGRADIAVLLEATPVLDCMLIRREADPPYTLAGTMKRYGLGELTGAHDAAADCLGTLAVLAAQAACGDFADVDKALGLGASKAPAAGAVDSQGKLLWVGGSAPNPPTPTQDNVMIDFGKNKGLTLRQAGAGFGRWIIGKDFDEDVKSVFRAAFAPASARW